MITRKGIVFTFHFVLPPVASFIQISHKILAEIVKTHEAFISKLDLSNVLSPLLSFVLFFLQKRYKLRRRHQSFSIMTKRLQFGKGSMLVQGLELDPAL